MDVLIRFGFSIEEIKSMMDTNIEIDKSDDKDLEVLIEYLISIGCSRLQVKNILIANPFYLNREFDKILKLIKSMEKVGLTHLNVLFDSNPFLLNLDSDEFLKIFKDKRKEGFNEEEVINYICYELI